MPVKEERVKEVLMFAAIHGDAKALETFQIKEDTLRRYRAKFPEIDEELENTKQLMEISKLYNKDELKAIAKGGRIVPGLEQVPIITNFKGDRVKFGFVTDSHIGSIYFHQEMWETMLRQFDESAVDFVIHSGDVTDGLSNRDDHVYQLTHIGYQRQKEYAVELFKQSNHKIFAISGNHDLYYEKSAGANIVAEICKDSGHTYVGKEEGDITLKGDVVLRAWHGRDGASYALSYRMQKIIESFTGGEKPHVLLAGHDHKAFYGFIRNVHAVAGGALTTQSKYMRAKRLANHTGFWIIEMTIGNKKVKSFKPEFFPFYQ